MDLEKRIASIEKQVRLYKRLGLLAVVVMAGSLIAGAAAPTSKVIESEKFVLKDGKGELHGVWNVAKGSPMFMMTIDSNWQTISRAKPALSRSPRTWRTL
jgi:hypothetical protein